MKVILNADVDNLGRKGDLVEVTPGYARNYLLPKKLALTASKGALRQAETMRRARQAREQRERDAAEGLAARIGALKLTVAARAGEEGQLFGSVTTSHIGEELKRALGHEIDRRKIHLPEPVRSLGVHEFTVQVSPDVTAQGSIEVIPEAYRGT